MKILALTLTLTFGFVSELTHDIKEAGIKIDLPGNAWTLADKQSNKMTVYSFKRKHITDSEGRDIIPNMAVIVEDIDPGTDAVAYTAIKRAQIPFEVIEVFTHESGKIKFKNAIAYKGKYIDSNKLKHTIFVVHAVNEKKGIQFICDSTTDVFSKVESEFLNTIKSIRK